MRRSLAAVLAGVLTGSLLTTVEPLITTPPPAVALSDSDCTPDVTVADGTLGNGTDGEPDQVGGNSSYVDAYAVDSDGDSTKDECVIRFLKPGIDLDWATEGFGGAEFDYLVVAGGGGAAFAGGGGGGVAEGLRSANTGFSGELLGPITRIRVGAGGNGAVPDNASNAANGEDSWIISSNESRVVELPASIDTAGDGEVRTGAGEVPAVVMKGGGGGARLPSANEKVLGSAGGSSGGSASYAGGTYLTTGVPPLNSAYGKTGGGSESEYTKIFVGGAGGGASNPGSQTRAYISGSSAHIAVGDGGEGLLSDLVGGSDLAYGSGGGGGANRGGQSASSARNIGTTDGGGGTDNTASLQNLQNGLPNRGGGGGAKIFDSATIGFDFGDWPGGSGGSGVVIVRFAPPPVDPAPVLGSVTRTDGGFRVPVSNVGDYSGSVSVSASAVTDSGGSTPTVEIDGVASGSFPVAVSSLSGGVVTVSGLDPGESAVLTVEASQAGFSPASVSVTGVAKASQAELVFPASLYSDSSAPVLSAVFGESVPVSVVGGSGTGNVSYSNVSGPCLVSSSGLVRLTGVGECVVTAVRAGDANFLSETVQDSLKITSNKAPQFVSFTSSVPADPVVGDTYTPTAEATGSGSVSFAVSGACSIASGVVTFTSASRCTITASSDSDTNYLAAADVTQVIVVGLANQTITFDAVGDKDFDDRPFQLSASSSRGLDVSFTTSSAACSVTSAGVVSIDATGLCEVTASQGGLEDQIAAASNVVRSFRVQAVIPGAPRLTSVGFGNESLTVGFIAPDYVGGGTISAYRAVATDGDGNEFVDNSCGTSSPCTVTGLTNGTDYTVTVAAVNEAGVGPLSNTSPGTQPAAEPDAVSGLSAVSGDGSLDVSWVKPTSFGGGTFDEYVVTVSDGTVTKTETLANSDSDVDEDSTSASFSGLTNGTAYDVTVVTNTTVNDETLASRTVSITGIPAVAPSAVRDAAAVLVGNTGAFVSWAAPASDGGLSITSYEVTPSSLSCDFDNALDQFCDITGLARGRTVSISIAAVNGIGAGQTVTVSVSTPALPSSGGGDDDGEEETASPVPSATPAPAAGPGGTPGRPGPGIPPRAPGGGPGGGPGAAPAPPGGTAGSPVTPDRPGATVGGQPVPTTTTARPGGRGVSVSAGGLDVGVDVPDPGDGRGGVIDRDGTPEPVVTPGQGKSISGAGAAPGSVVDVWLPGRGTTGPTNIAKIPVQADGSFRADVNLFADSENPLPIGRNVVQIVTTNAEGEEILVDMPFTLAQGTPVPEVLRETGSTPDAPTVGIINTNKGDPTVTRVTSVPDQGIVSVESDTWAFTVGINTDTGTVDGADTDTVIRTTSTSQVTVSGSGFMPDTRVDIWAFSEPTLLGNATVGPDGTVSVTVAITPQALDVGAHTLQLQAVGQDGFIRTSNLPVEIEATQAIATTSDGAGTLLWWILSIAIAVILLALLVTLLIRRRQQA